jgi:hypothetical protein
MTIKSNQETTAIAVLCSMLALFMVLAIAATAAAARRASAVERDAQPISSPKQVLPNPQQRVHRVPDVQMCLTNWGLVGSRMRHLDESLWGCFSPNPDEELPASSFEYPPGSGLEYLFYGAIWIGAKVDGNVYTSVGCDGWQWIYELWPDAGSAGAILERSSLPGVPCYSTDAVSGHDVIAIYTDTSEDIPLSPMQQDPWDNRKHYPLHIQVTQTSYSWGEEGLDKFIIAEYSIRNIGRKKIQDVYLGIYVDPDIMHISENPSGEWGGMDDITGFLKDYEISSGDTISVNMAWAADNDGINKWPLYFTETDPRSVLGVKVLHASAPNLRISYNWWTSNVTGFPHDWGPWLASNQDVWAAMNPYGSGGYFPEDWANARILGTPGGDVSKYFLMSNGEIDYDQIYACVWPSLHPEQGWLPANPRCGDYTNGIEIQFLYSFGPFEEISPGDNLIVAVAYVIGESLHVDPLNLYSDPNMTDPDAFYADLYFDDLVKNALKAESLYFEAVYDHPPGPFSLLFPPNKAFVPRRLRFDWEDAVDPDASDWVKYDLYVSTSYHFPFESTRIFSNLSESQCIQRLDDGAYFWKVKAKDRRGAETWSSQIRSLVVSGIPYSTLGDLNTNGVIDIGDVVLFVNYLYRSDGAPEPLGVGDCNCDGMANIGDVVFLLNYLFKSGPSPSCP